MATVTVEVHGRPYTVGCADGQEERVRQLARVFDDNVKQVAGDVGAVGDLRLFLMAALLLADEAADLRAQLNRLKVEHDRVTQGFGPPPATGPASGDVERRAALALEAAADRIERLTAELA
jgi:cell division protein ZapA